MNIVEHCSWCCMFDVQVRGLQTKLDNLTTNLGFLRPDQKRVLEAAHSYRNKGITWTLGTVKTAFQLRFVCGVKGYEFIRSLGYPLPSYRTLCDRVQPASFRPGVQLDVLRWLAVKMEGMQSQEKDCVLMMDEMQVRKSLEYDRGLNTFLGRVSDGLSLSSSVGSSQIALASHALVFMVRGLTTAWKQVIAYYLTGDSMSGVSLWDITRSIILALGSSGINVRAVVSDMGSSNRAMWKVVGVAAGRDSVKSSIVHPFFQEQDLYFLADVPHLLKNVRNCLLTQDIVLPASVLAEYDLPSAEVRMKHVSKLVELQENSDLKIAPSLSRHHVEPKQFQKMKVGLAAQLISHSTASALRFAVQADLLPQEALTTAWFLEFVNNWFDVANARCRSQGLFQSSGAKVQTLLTMLEIAPKLTFSGGRNSTWKPIQTGILISTQSLLDLYASLVATGNYHFLLTSRLTQDALENLFSQIRGRGDSHPSPVHFRHCLRLISVAQFMKVTDRSSYSIDDSTYAMPFLKTKHPADCSISRPGAGCQPGDGCISRPVDIVDGDSSCLIPFLVEDGIVRNPSGGDMCDTNALYYLTGWIAFKVKHELKSCSSCTDFLSRSGTSDSDNPQARLTHLKSFGGLTHPSDALHTLIFAAEEVFTSSESESLLSSNVLELLLSKCTLLLSNLHLPQCHDVGRRVLTRFFRLRSHICSKRLSKSSEQERQHGSKSAKIRSTVN
jgi:hypothetical protein